MCNEKCRPTSSKTVAKSFGEAQKKIDIASARGCTRKEILQYDHIECPLFENGSLARHSKHEILNPLETLLVTSDYQFNTNEVRGLAVVVDFMPLIHKLDLKSIPN